MRKKLFRIGLCSVLAIVLALGCVLPTFASTSESEDEPILTIACTADPHCDYGLQSLSARLRNSFIHYCQEMMRTENADLMLVGGDMTSDNAGLAKQGGWSKSTYSEVIFAYDKATSSATDSGITLYAAGNHEHQAGLKDSYDPYEGFVDLMNESAGDPLSVYTQREDAETKKSAYPNHPLGLRYRVKGFDFLIINAPMGTTENYTDGTVEWLADELAEIGSDKTVFLVGHYPLDTLDGYATTYAKSSGSYAALTDVLRNYPNLIYLFGHIHGDDPSLSKENQKTSFIHTDTFERIFHYTSTGATVTSRKKEPTSFLSVFMGSTSYYRYYLNPGWLGAADPEIVQGLMIYVYSDRIEFAMKNYGKQVYSTQELKSWTVNRTVVSSESLGSDSPVTDVPAIDSSDLTTSGGNGNSVLIAVLIGCGVLILAGIAVLIAVLCRKPNESDPKAEQPAEPKSDPAPEAQTPSESVESPSDTSDELSSKD